MLIKKIYLYLAFLFLVFPCVLLSQTVENFDSYLNYADFIPNSGLYDDTPSSASAAYIVKEITNEEAYSGNCLHYLYNLTNVWDNIQFTYWSTSDWSNALRLTFWIKASTNVEKVTFFFKESDDMDEWVWETTTLSTQWQKIVLPLQVSSWTYVDWDSDGGTTNLTHAVIDHWRVYWETSVGGIENAEVWLDEIMAETNEISDDYSFDTYNDYYDFLIAGNDDSADPSSGYSVREIVSNGAYSGRALHYAYSIGNQWDTVGFANNNPTNWSGNNWLSFWIKGSNSNVTMDVIFKESDNDEWLYTFTDFNTNWKNILIPLTGSPWLNVDWDADGGPATFDVSSLVSWDIRSEAGAGGVTGYELWIDEVSLLTNSLPFDDWSFNSFLNYDGFLTTGIDDSVSDWNPADLDTFYNLKEITALDSWSGQCLHYNYDIGDPFESIGFMNNNQTNWSGYNWFSFYLKGDTSTEAVNVYFKEADNDEWVYSGISISSNWTQKLISLDPGSWSVADWDGDGGSSTFDVTNLTSWGIFVESSLGGASGQDVYFDEMELLTNELPFDDWSFDSFINYDVFLSTGISDTPSDWNPADGDVIYNVKEITTNQAYSGQCLHYNYDIGDPFESIGFMNQNVTNWSGHTWLSFWAKGDSLGISLGVYFKQSNNDEWAYSGLSLSTNWKQMLIPFDESSWIYADWDGDGGPHVFSITNIQNWSLYIESSGGGIAGYDIFLDDISILTNPLPFDDWTFDSFLNYDTFLSSGISDAPSDWNPNDADTYFNLKEITTNGAKTNQCLHYNYSIGDPWESVGFVNNNATNWAGATSLGFWIKGYAGDSEILDVFFKEADNDEWIYQFNGLNSAWQEIKIPFTAGAWSSVDWDGDGGPGTFSTSGITRWSLSLENGTGGIVNKDVWFDQIHLNYENYNPEILSFYPVYQCLSNNPLISIVVYDPQGLDTNSIVLTINSIPVPYSVSVQGNSNIIQYETIGLTYEQRTKVELDIADLTGLSQYFSWSFWVGEQERSFDTFEYDQVHFSKYWSPVFYNAVGSVSSETNIAAEGNNSVKIRYSFDPVYGEYGIQKTFSPVQNWLGYSNFYIRTASSNIQTGLNLDVIVYELSGDIWYSQIYDCFNQFAWELQTVDISDNLSSFLFADWCTNEPGWLGDKLPNADQIQSITLNLSGSGLSGTAYIDDFFIHGKSVIDFTSPVFVTNQFKPMDGDLGVSTSTNIYIRISDDNNVSSNSVYVRMAVVTHNSEHNYTVQTQTVLSNGSFFQNFSGALIPNGVRGYDILFNYNTDFPDGTEIRFDAYAEDVSGNNTQYEYSFFCKGVYFNHIVPADGSVNIMPDSSVCFWSDKIDTATLSVFFSNNISVSTAVMTGLGYPGYSLSASGYWADTYKYSLSLSNILPLSTTNYLLLRAQDALGNFTAQRISFVTISSLTIIHPVVNYWYPSQTINLKWEKPDDMEESGIKEYHVFFCSTNNIGSSIQSNLFFGENNTNGNNIAGLPDGKLYIHVKAKNNNNHYAAQSSFIPFFVDSTGPDSVHLYSPQNDQWVRTNMVRLFWSTVSDSLTIVSNYIIEISSNISFMPVNTAMTIQATNYQRLQSYSEGLWWWRVSALDSLGNRSVIATNAQFKVDVTPPALYGFYPQNGEKVSSLSIDMSWSSYDALSGIPVSDAYYVRVYTNNNFTVPETDEAISSSMDLSGYFFQQDTTNAWQISVVDNAGNTNLSSLMVFSVDNTSSIPFLYSPVYTLITNSLPLFRWSKTLNGTTNLLVVSSNSSFSDFLISDQSFNTNYQPVAENLREGTNWWKVGVYDSSLSQWVYSVPVYTIVDLTPPTISSLLSPTDEIWTNNTDLLFTWSEAFDPLSGIAHYRVVVSTNSNFTVLKNDIQTLSAFTYITGLERRNYFWRVYAVDNAGRQTVSSVRSFNIDNIPPQILTLVSPSLKLVPVSNPVLSWEKGLDLFMDTESGIAKYILSLSESSSFNYTNYQYEVSGSMNTNFTVLDSLHDGIWYWKGRAVDEAGNSGIISMISSFTVDGSPPLISFNIPDGATNISKYTSLSFTLSDNRGVLSNTINVFVNNLRVVSNGFVFSPYIGAITNIDSFGYHVWLSNFSFLDGQNVSISISVMDLPGSIITNVFNFKISGQYDLLAPILTINYPSGDYFSAILVEITANEPSRIYYSTNGILPDVTGIYSNSSVSILIDHSVVLKYFGVDLAGNYSVLGDQEYSIFLGSEVEQDAFIIPNFIDLSKSETAIIFIKRAGEADIKVYDLSADLVKDFGTEIYEAYDIVEWDGAGLPSGTYIIIISGPEIDEIIKLIQIR